MQGIRFAIISVSLKQQSIRFVIRLLKLGSGFKVTAYSDDGVIEVIENSEYLAIGVQFHPETSVCDKGRKEFLKLLSRPLR